MARTKKVKTTAEKIQDVEALIASKKAELTDLENTLTALKEEKKQEDLLVLYTEPPTTKVAGFLGTEHT